MPNVLMGPGCEADFEAYLEAKAGERGTEVLLAKRLQQIVDKKKLPPEGFPPLANPATANSQQRISLPTPTEDDWPSLPIGGRSGPVRAGRKGRKRGTKERRRRRRRR